MGILIKSIRTLFYKQERKYNYGKRPHISNKKSLTNTYLLEYRYSGYPKKYLLNRYFELKRKYRITHPNYHYVPHITIAGPIITKHGSKLIEIIEEIIFRNAPKFYEPGNLIMTGEYIKFDTDVGGQVLAIRVKPPKSLVNLKKEIEDI